MKDFLAKFNSPGASYRGMPFWSWNAELDTEELTRQIRDFKKMGFGGFFMHARVGLATEYLGEQWFSCVKTCIDEAEKCGLIPYLYDEDRWPSGAAGGKVTSNEKFRMRMLKWETAGSADKLSASGNTLAFYIVRGNAEKRIMDSYRKISDPAAETLAEGEFFVRGYWIYEKESAWFNGATYLDTMDEEAVQQFINATHEKYKAEIGDAFGKKVPGIFTDEPNYMHFAYMAFPWTRKMEEKFLERYNYHIVDHLPEIFFNLHSGISKVRWDFFNIATDLFVHSFGKQIGSWCGKNDLKLTGHVLGEDSLTVQTLSVGSAMRFYEYMQIPGIDMLTEIWNAFITAKLCTSAARQFGKPERLTELYGCTGWDFPLAGHKAIGDWQFALGITFRCLHLAHYSMLGEAKRDYPASISYQSPWFSKYSHVEDYFARIGVTISGAEEIRDMLFILPIESYWLTYLPFEEILPDDRPINDKEFEWLSRDFLKENLDFDYGEEDIISRHGSVKNGVLKIGKAGYKAVFIPQLLTIRKTTLDLLKDFAKAGGKVCYIGNPPEYVNAEKSDDAANIFAEYFQPVTKENCVAELSPAARRLSFTDKQGKEIHPLLAFFGKQPGYYTLFICNNGTEFSDNLLNDPRILDRTETFDHANIAVKMEYYGNVYELDPVSGKIVNTDAEYVNGEYRFTTSFDILQSRLYVICQDMPESAVSKKYNGETKLFAALPDKNWQITLDEPNALVLDIADAWVNGKKEFEHTLILNIDKALREKLGAGKRGEQMKQPWVTKNIQPAEKLDLRLEYSFDIGVIPQNIRLAVETPDLYDIRINGKKLDTSNTSWWVDRSIRSVCIPENMLVCGKNIMTMECRYHVNMPGLEMIYLLGDFGVNANDVITFMPSTLDCGNWCQQGLPYYSGSITYSCVLPILPENKAVWLSFPAWKGNIITVSVNDSGERSFAWAPCRIQLPARSLKRDGSDRLKITLCSHRRNAFGPFYLKSKWSFWGGSSTFSAYETDGVKNLVECGLSKPPVLEIEK